MFNRYFARFFVLIAVFFSSLVQAAPIASPTPVTAAAVIVPNSIPTLAKYPVPAAPSIDAKAYLLMDANSGQVLASSNAMEKLPPASLTKLMTIDLAFTQLAAGKIHLTDMVTISEQAWRMGGSKMFIRVGAQVSVDDLLKGAIIASGNDATTALAEYIGGDESVFVQMMNQQAQALGMTNTHYTDATGLPDPNHYTTAYDLATLARTIIQTFPQYYSYFSEKWFTFNNIKQNNRNLLLWRDPSVDGLKTGHTDEAGYCLVASAKQGDMRLISVVLGTDSESARANASEALLRYGFRFYQSRKLYTANQSVEAVRVYYGKQNKINIGSLKDIVVTLPADAFKNMQTTVTLPKKIEAPLQKGQTVGNLLVTVDGQTVNTIPLVALEDNPQAGALGRFADWIASIF